ncbi:MAG: exo-alpha-sialidase [Chloroflexi bacterium]|nr:MAG: exo-alpha-sialidase [Chloroflexota bacterium]TMF82230.1 MAG: exo-alpha-sialidase [Chloroflexota bacterium]TMG14640.1 MAG: exo-alpha-sialidase [Chloroflexota bacterium]
MRRLPAPGLLILVGLIAMLPPGTAAAKSGLLNIDASQRPLNESEEAIAINPTNPKNIVIVTNVGHREAGLDAGMFEAVSFDGGTTWTRKLIGDKDNLGDACCDPTLSFDEFGNLFMSYLFEVENTVPIALSTDGGLTFNLVGNIVAPPKGTPTKTSGDNRGLFRFVDQPTITAARGEVWVIFNAGGPLFATGAAVAGFGQVGSFFQGEVVPGTNNCTYGDIAIGPTGQVMQVCTLTESGQGGGRLFVNVDLDGLGPAGFGDRVFVAETHVGGFDFIPPQRDRSIDAEPGLAWDRTGGARNGRVYLVYTKEIQNESDNTDIFVRFSDDNGATWSQGVRVNDDQTPNSQFLPKIALDQTSGNVAAVWYDARRDLGTGGAGDTDGIANDDAQLWGAFSTDGGATFGANVQISAGTSNSHDSGNGIDYGDYSGLAFYGGKARPAWSDNSNSTGTNPDGALHQLDIYTAAVHP